MQRGGCRSKSNNNSLQHLGSDIRLAALCEVHLAQSATQTIENVERAQTKQYEAEKQTD